MLLSSSPHTVAPPHSKRKMRMYADDIEEEKSKRLVFAISSQLFNTFMAD